MPSDEMMSKLPKETQKAIRDITNIEKKQYRRLKASERKHLQKSRDELLETLRTRIDVCIWTGDIEGFERLITQIEILTKYELLKSIEDKGYGKDIEVIIVKMEKDAEVQYKNTEKV